LIHGGFDSRANQSGQADALAIVDGQGNAVFGSQGVGEGEAQE
jgi:hypothetical protein